MEGVTTFPMRYFLYVATQAAVMTTPFLRATEAHPGATLPPAFAPELGPLRGLFPYHLTPQLLASEPDHFLRAADLLPPEVADMIELNCGCPSPNSAGQHAGSGILRDPVRFGATVERLVRTLGSARLAIKMRVGFTGAEEFAALLPHVADQDLARLTVHGRTRADGYRGRARWDLIGQAAARTKVPTWASGDVEDHGSLLQLRATAPQVRGAMVGRAILRNPWIFTELATGVPVHISPLALANALLVYAVLNELWITEPERLIARLAKGGRIAEPCGVDAGAWERAAAIWTSVLYGRPFVLFPGAGRPAVALSPTTYTRVQYLWAHLMPGMRVKKGAGFSALMDRLFSDAPDLITLSGSQDR